MDKNTFLNKAAEFAKIRDEYQKMIVDNGKNIFSELAQDVFSKNPKLNDFKWYQYTPYYDDGGSCKFGVERNSFKLNTKTSEEHFDFWYFDFPKYKSKYLDTINCNDYGFDTLDDLFQAVKDIKELMDVFSDDDYKIIFGDHTQVTVSNNGEISVDNYDHD